MGELRASVVVATYNRGASLRRLLTQLGAQTLPAGDFETVVVDDGSTEPVAPALEGLDLPFALRVERQANAGAAAARHRGALAARAEVLVIVDDDMQVGPGFLAEHLRWHAPGTRRVVIGRIRPFPVSQTVPLFERWHQRNLDRFAERVRANTTRPGGGAFYTGNVSLRRADYLAVGGFDTALRQAEDVELGIRLEKAGLDFVYAEDAWTVNGSDHLSLERWRRRAHGYGIHSQRIAHKHPEVRHASPWALFGGRAAVLPVFAAAATVPGASQALAHSCFAAGYVADRMGLERLAYVAMSLVFALDYYRGVRDELGSARALWAGLLAWMGSAARDGIGRAGACPPAPGASPDREAVR